MAVCYAGSAFSLDTDKVIAYPVPFNPKKHSLSVMDKSAAPLAASMIMMEIYDINGDLVFSRRYASLEAVKWNGRNDSGVMVKPGLYIIKLEIEDSSGGYGKKLIRIVVNY